MQQSSGIETLDATARRGALASSRRPSARDLAISGLLLLAYVALEWISFIHEHKGVPITPWNPGLGLLFAFMVLNGPHYGVLLFAGVLIAELAVLQSSLAWYAILAISLIISGAYSAAAAAVRSNMHIDVGLNRLRDILALLLTALLAASLVAILISPVLALDQDLGLSDILVATWPLLVGDVIGIAVVTPLVLRTAAHSRQELLRMLVSMLPQAALFVVTVGLCLWIIVAPKTDFHFFYLLFLPVGVAAVRYGLDGACLALALTQFGLVGLLHRYGYDANAFTEFQIQMLVLSSTGLIVGVIVTERQHDAEMLRAYEARLRAKEAEVVEAMRLNLVSGMASTLAHEINQPMTAARALARSAQQLLRTNGDLARAEANLGNLIAQIDHAGSVVRRMRDFLRRGRPHVSTVDIKDMLQEVLMLVRLQATERRVEVQVDAEAELPPLHADRVQLEQVVLNLVGNAIEAVGGSDATDRRVIVRARRAQGQDAVEIAVADTGPGVPPDLADRLFEPLITSKHGGLGLGLSICAGIVEAHGGRIWLHSGAPGATEFRFTLPLTSLPQT